MKSYVKRMIEKETWGDSVILNILATELNVSWLKSKLLKSMLFFFPQYDHVLSDSDIPLWNNTWFKSQGWGRKDADMGGEISPQCPIERCSHCTFLQWQPLLRSKYVSNKTIASLEKKIKKHCCSSCVCLLQLRKARCWQGVQFPTLECKKLQNQATLVKEGVMLLSSKSKGGEKKKRRGKKKRSFLHLVSFHCSQGTSARARGNQHEKTT